MNRQVNTTFCDDIRHEVNGKLSLIGVYSGQMLVPSFPVILPQLCLVIVVLTPVEQPFQKLILRVLKDDTVLIEGEIPQTELPKAGSTSVVNDGDTGAPGRLLSVQSQIVISPFAVEGPCILRVRVITEAGELKGQGLGVQLSPQ